MYLHFLCSYNNSRRCICLYGVKDVQKEEFIKFNWNDQPLDQHNELVRNRIVALGVRRTRKVLVELCGADLAEYHNGEEFIFKGKILKTPENQIEKMAQREANKRIGVIKRKKTIANKQTTTMESGTECEKLKEMQKKIADRAAQLVLTYEESVRLTPPQQQNRSINQTLTQDG